MAMHGHDAPTIRLRVHRPGPLGVVHARQLRWHRAARIGWWLFLLPLAIFAWSSWRLRGVARGAGYVAAGFVFLFGIAVFSAPAPPPVPTTVAAPAPLVTTTTPAPIAVVPAPVVPPTSTPAPVPAAAPPTTASPLPSVRRPAPRSTYATPSRPRTAARVPSVGSSRGDTYTNVDGDQVRRPVAAASAPAGATAQCRDGTWSSSRNRSGTCSSHGGVARWL